MNIELPTTYMKSDKKNDTRIIKGITAEQIILSTYTVSGYFLFWSKVLKGTLLRTGKDLVI